MGLGNSETEHTGDDPDEMGDALQVANLGGEDAQQASHRVFYFLFSVELGINGAAGRPDFRVEITAGVRSPLISGCASSEIFGCASSEISGGASSEISGGKKK